MVVQPLGRQSKSKELALVQVPESIGIEQRAAVLAAEAPTYEIQLEGRPLERSWVEPRGLYALFGKRLLDLCLASALLVLLAPVYVICGVLVVTATGWPPLYAARRMGRGGREFSMWKIRTMVRDADKAIASWRETDPELANEYERNFKLTTDPRTTSLGRFLRRTSLDELPQLWNVVKGEMSLVGPRPYYLRELQQFPMSAFEEITSVRPGLTGPWQTGGRNTVLPSTRIQIDCEYVWQYSLRFDLVCIAKTILVLVRAEGL